MKLLNSEYNCKFCEEENKDNNSYKLSRDDFSKKPIFKAEKEKLIYKRRDNFKSEEEYNEYFEFVEKYLRKNNLKEIEKNFQSLNEKEENKDKKEKELRLVKDVIRENNPTQYNNTKICIYLEENINQDDKSKENDPIRIIYSIFFFINIITKKCHPFEISKIKKIIES